MCHYGIGRHAHWTCTHSQSIACGKNPTKAEQINVDRCTQPSIALKHAQPWTWGRSPCCCAASWQCFWPIFPICDEKSCGLLFLTLHRRSSYHMVAWYVLSSLEPNRISRGQRRKLDLDIPSRTIQQAHSVFTGDLTTVVGCSACCASPAPQQPRHLPRFALSVVEQLYPKRSLDEGEDSCSHAPTETPDKMGGSG